MVRLPPIDDCKRSNLLEILPYPLIPDTEYVRQIDCPPPASRKDDNDEGKKSIGCVIASFSKTTAPKCIYILRLRLGHLFK